MTLGVNETIFVMLKSYIMRQLFIHLCILGFSFSSLGQSDCSLLEIDMQVNPFNTSEIFIYVSNPSSQSFNYPGFRVFKDGIQIGEEEVLFFGIANQSTHRVILDPMPLENESVNYTLELWTNFYGDLACQLQYSGIPFNSSACFPVMLSIYGTNTGSNLQVNITEEITNSTVLETDVILNSTNPIFSDELCLLPGCYSCEVVATSGVFSSPIYLDISNQVDGNVSLFYLAEESGQTAMSGTFEVWNGCSVGIEESSKMYSFYPNPINAGEHLTLSHTGFAMVYDSRGRLVLSTNHLGSLKITLDPGIYLVRCENQTERIIVN